MRLILTPFIIWICLSQAKSFTARLFSDYGLPVADDVLEKYGHFPSNLRNQMKIKVQEMFYFSYDNYMQHAWPKDELNPIFCTGRGPDWSDPTNININDALGNYSLTLIDSLGSLLVFGNFSEFQRAVSLILDTVTFDQDVTVQVFESTIRVVDLAVDLTERLSRAFDGSPTGLPYPRVNLRHGVPEKVVQKYENCLAGAGSLLLEFGKLTGNEKYMNLAKGAVRSLWQRRSNITGLLGNTIDIRSGAFLDGTSGLGAGMDSFYEYLMKSYILFGDEESLTMWKEIYSKIKLYEKIGGVSCGTDAESHPLFINVDMNSGTTSNIWVDSLAASFPAVQLLDGDFAEAICLHNFYASQPFSEQLWTRYGGLPERFDWVNQRPVIPLYPLRPELAESTYFLYRATKNPFYLHFGARMVEDLINKGRVRCGFATIHSLLDGTHEDRMESFFLSETLKYLYLLFDEDNFVNRHETKLLFTTEGHIIPLSHKFLEKRNYASYGTDKLNNQHSCSTQNVLLRHALPVQAISWNITQPQSYQC